VCVLVYLKSHIPWSFLTLVVIAHLRASQRQKWLLYNFSNLGDNANYIVYIHASRGQMFIVYVDASETITVGVNKR
jgi:hypothetical protein